MWEALTLQAPVPRRQRHRDDEAGARADDPAAVEGQRRGARRVRRDRDARARSRSEQAPRDGEGDGGRYRGGPAQARLRREERSHREVHAGDVQVAHRRAQEARAGSRRARARASAEVLDAAFNDQALASGSPIEARRERGDSRLVRLFRPRPTGRISSKPTVTARRRSSDGEERRDRRRQAAMPDPRQRRRAGARRRWRARRGSAAAASVGRVVDDPQKRSYVAGRRSARAAARDHRDRDRAAVAATTKPRRSHAARPARRDAGRAVAPTPVVDAAAGRRLTIERGRRAGPGPRSTSRRRRHARHRRRRRGSHHRRHRPCSAGRRRSTCRDVSTRALQAYVKGDTKARSRCCRRRRPRKPRLRADVARARQGLQEARRDGPAKKAFQKYLQLAPSASDATADQRRDQEAMRAALRRVRRRDSRSSRASPRGPRKVLVLPARRQRRCRDAEATLNDIVEAREGELDGDVTAGDTTFDETAAAVGCDPTHTRARQRCSRRSPSTSSSMAPRRPRTARRRSSCAASTKGRRRTSRPRHSPQTRRPRGQRDPARAAVRRDDVVAGPGSASAAAPRSRPPAARPAAAATGTAVTRERKLGVGLAVGGGALVLVGLRDVGERESAAEIDIDARRTTRPRDIQHLRTSRARRTATRGAATSRAARPRRRWLRRVSALQDHQEATTLTPAPPPSGTGMKFVLRRSLVMRREHPRAAADVGGRRRLPRQQRAPTR